VQHRNPNSSKLFPSLQKDLSQNIKSIKPLLKKKMKKSVTQLTMKKPIQ